MDITGQVIFRFNGQDSPKKDGKKIVIIFGLLAMPEDMAKELSEKQFAICGKELSSISLIELTVLKDHQVDMSDHPDVCGNGINGALRAPIWRV